MIDALEILKYLANMQTLTLEQTEQYDFFNNGEIKILNALEIMKKFAGMDSLVPD